MCLARSLAAEPEVVLMDEVTSSVDPAARIALEELARSCAAAGVHVLWVTHDLAQARGVADHIVVVLDGGIAHVSSVAELDASAPVAVRAFMEGESDAH